MKNKKLILFTLFSLLIGYALTLNAEISQSEAHEAFANLKFYKAWSTRNSYKAIQTKVEEALKASETALGNKFDNSWTRVSLAAFQTRLNNNHEIQAVQSGIKNSEDELLKDVEEQKNILMEYAQQSK